MQSFRRVERTVSEFFSAIGAVVFVTDAFGTDNPLANIIYFLFAANYLLAFNAGEDIVFWEDKPEENEEKEEKISNALVPTRAYVPADPYKIFLRSQYFNTFVIRQLEEDALLEERHRDAPIIMGALIQFIASHAEDYPEFYSLLSSNGYIEQEREQKEMPLLMPYHNMTTFLMNESVFEIKPENLVVLDGYAFDAEELIEAAKLDAENFYRNPYAEKMTNKEFSVLAKQKIRKHPALSAHAKEIDSRLLSQGGAILPQSVSAMQAYLFELRDNQLNGSQDALQTLYLYMSNLPEIERLPLLNYNIFVESLFGGNNAMRLEHVIANECIYTQQMYGWQFVLDFRPHLYALVPPYVHELAEKSYLKIQTRNGEQKEQEEKSVSRSDAPVPDEWNFVESADLLRSESDEQDESLSLIARVSTIGVILNSFSPISSSFTRMTAMEDRFPDWFAPSFQNHSLSEGLSSNISPISSQTNEENEVKQSENNESKDDDPVAMFNELIEDNRYFLQLLQSRLSTLSPHQMMLALHPLSVSALHLSRAAANIEFATLNSLSSLLGRGFFARPPVSSSPVPSANNENSAQNRSLSLSRNIEDPD